MGRVLLCVGNHAKQPYDTGKLGRRVYSIEELCYCFRERAFLLDQDILDRGLVRWIDEECGLPELAQELYRFLNQASSVSAFVATILEYTGYCTAEEARQTEQLLKNNAGLSAQERRKAYADFLLQQQKYDVALREYQKIMQEIPEVSPEFGLRVKHNMGVAYAGLFVFQKAAEILEQCYQEDQNPVSGLDFLAARRLYMTEEAYIAFLAERPELFELSLELEKTVEQTKHQWTRSEKGSELRTLMQKKEDGSKGEYYGGIDRITVKMKEDYRKMINR